MTKNSYVLKGLDQPSDNHQEQEGVNQEQEMCQLSQSSNAPQEQDVMNQEQQMPSNGPQEQDGINQEQEMCQLIKMLEPQFTMIFKVQALELQNTLLNSFIQQKSLLQFQSQIKEFKQKREQKKKQKKQNSKQKKKLINTEQLKQQITYDLIKYNKRQQIKAAIDTFKRILQSVVQIEKLQPTQLLTYLKSQSELIPEEKNLSGRPTLYQTLQNIHPLISNLFSNCLYQIGNAYHKLYAKKYYSKQMRYLKISQMIKQYFYRRNPSQQFNLIAVYNALGVVMDRLNRKQKSKEYHQKAVSLANQFGKNKDADYGIYLYNLESFQIDTGQVQQLKTTLVNFLKIQQIFRTYAQKRDEDLLLFATLSKISQIHMKLYNFTESLEYLNYAIINFEININKTHKFNTQNVIKQIHKKKITFNYVKQLQDAISKIGQYLIDFKEVSSHIWNGAELLQSYTICYHQLEGLIEKMQEYGIKQNVQQF